MSVAPSFIDDGGMHASNISALSGRTMLVLREAIGHTLAVIIDMKLTITFSALVLALTLGACSTAKKPTREVTLVPCCATGDPEKVVLLQDSFEPGGRVVRLAPH